MPHLRLNPRPPRYDSALAISELSAADTKLGKLIASAGPFTMKLASTQSPFEALLESIVYQQLHGKAAATIHRRLIESFASVTDLAHPDPQHILDCPNEQLRFVILRRRR
jgi:DNA-3-methyladenine glycosylase II